MKIIPPGAPGGLLLMRVITVAKIMHDCCCNEAGSCPTSHPKTVNNKGG